MRAPISLEDRTLLEEEPFASAFSTRHDGPKKQAPRHFLEKIVGEVEKASGGIKAVEEWVSLVFEPTDAPEPRKHSLRGQRGRRKTSKLSVKILKLFVKFYWYLFTNQDTMQLLRTQKLEGYTCKLSQIIVKQEPDDEPMSPLTEMSDDDTPPFPTSLESSAVAKVPRSQQQNSKPSHTTTFSNPVKATQPASRPALQLPEASFVSRPTDGALREVPLYTTPKNSNLSHTTAFSTPVKATQPPAHPDLQLPEASFVSRPTDGALGGVPLYTTPNAPAADLESNSIMQTPVRAKTSRRLTAPEPPRRGRPRTSGRELPANGDTSAQLPPRTAPSNNDIMMSDTPGHNPEPAVLVTPSFLIAKAPQLARPVREWPASGYHSPYPAVPRPLPVGVEIKSDPSEENSNCLRLMNPADVPENWLNRPLNDVNNQSDELQGHDLIIEPQYRPKPPLPVLPPIWAQSRQEVCESFEWFRSYQGGVYQNDGTVRGYFLSAYSAKRDHFACGGKIIISHGGGKAESSRKQAGHVTNTAADDQRAQDLSVRALIETYRRNQPLVLLIDDKYGPFPFDLGSRDVYMAILGFYKIIHMWAEYQPSSSHSSGRVVRYKFAFQWCEDQGEPWWLQENLDAGILPRSEDVGTPIIAENLPTSEAVGTPIITENLPTSEDVGTPIIAEYLPTSKDVGTPIIAENLPTPEAVGTPIITENLPTSEDVGTPIITENLPESGDVGTPTIVPTETVTIPRPLKPDHLYFLCATCSETSPRVYRAWACLNPACASFWTTSSGHPLPDELDYNPEFLTVIDFRPLPFSHRDALLPKPPVLAPENGITTTYMHSRGWHCRKCGRLSCRSAWEHYQCPNCKETHVIVSNVRPAKNLMSIRVPISDKFVDSLIDPFSGIQRMQTRIFNHSDIAGATGRSQTFILPEGKGRIHLLQTNRLANVAADRIFEAYQQQASDGTLLFRRWPLRSHKLRGPLLTNYFSQNSGETYHYVGGTDNTVPFDRAPSAIVQARDLIQRRIHEACGTKVVFNEVLSAAYMEQQKMAFHSDSERGLGPVVAGLSMGSPALMHFRLLSKYASRTEQRANAMTVVLRHGDVLVMEGAGVQDFYEHTVVPCNFRIAATARWIEPNHA
ncbi:hypothetical protein C8R44DRAFT_808235 [Mycena epipterygia]|nr:hypothetical protein C8R44DRAFT_808235 [Mycena epipterygia]